MNKPTETLEPFGELGRVFKDLEDRYGLEYFCLAIYPLERTAGIRSEKCRPYISKDKKLVARTLANYFKMSQARAEHRLKQEAKANKQPICRLVKTI